ncbi:metallophosphoesterase [Geomicrobium sediminis]|uniref:MPP superfamily phosphohydrolase n=1 Tax=Geomicrobium sediminis TaxID=1347788 RepID=A0ABS2PF10_9BACL|nr:metallophosphoesterase [Geomicrobium sediminis]MBM7633561.1 putative MPP superfamily phosphohydrolase [Geomicrobium sediminis]
MTLLLFLLLPLVIMLIAMSIQANTLVVEEKTFEVEGNHKDCSLLFISDLHKRRLNDRHIKTINTVDCVIVGGDFVERTTTVETLKHNLNMLKKLSTQVIVVYGNHDYRWDQRRLRTILDQANITVLENEGMYISDCIYVYGTKDESTKQAVVQKRGLGDYYILVSHNPIVALQHPNSRLYDLILSGHTHGGQIRLFGLGLRERGRWLQIGSAKMRISNGFGTRKVHLRLGAPPEVHHILLKKGATTSLSRERR